MYGGMYCNSIKLSSLDKQRVYPKPLCILFLGTKGIRWADTDATLSNGGIRKGHLIEIIG